MLTELARSISNMGREEKYIDACAMVQGIATVAQWRNTRGCVWLHTSKMDNVAL